MNQEYTHIAALTIKHQYFRDGVFDPIQFSMTEDSNRVLRDLGIVVKQFSGGLHVFASNPEIALDTDRTLIINMFCEDPYFINYSDFGDYSITEDILYFNNQGTSILNDNEMRVLQTNEFVSTADIQKFTSNAAVSKKPMGIVELSIKRLFNDFEVMNKNTVNYDIHFKTRYTIWKYFVMIPENRQFDNLSIVDQNGIPMFEQIATTVVGEHEALVFESKSTLPLLEDSEDNFQLVGNIPNGEPFSMTLPNASPEQLYTGSPNNEGIYYSHMYIYI